MTDLESEVAVDPLAAALRVFDREGLAARTQAELGQALELIIPVASQTFIAGCSDADRHEAVSAVVEKWLRKGIPRFGGHIRPQAIKFVRRSVTNAYRDACAKAIREENKQRAASIEPKGSAFDRCCDLNDLDLEEGIERLRQEILVGIMAEKHSAKDDSEEAFELRVRICHGFDTLEGQATDWVATNQPPSDASKIEKRKVAQGKAWWRLMKEIFALIAILNPEEDPENLRYRAAKCMKNRKSKRGLGQQR